MNSPHLADHTAGPFRRRFVQFLYAVEVGGLVVIGLATAFAMLQEALKVFLIGQVLLTDLLLMFLYLEVLEMTVRYLRLGRLPVRFPLYIAMASLARDLILRGGTGDSAHILMTTGGIVMLAVGVIILRFGQNQLPSAGDDDHETSDRD
ncbi:phosphate-starvation-inducible protein PsiE [Paraburkholderia sp. BL18I3N2]|uniref:phosphate-starvation-inducible protein PsiE n=1 Tax=Paraburkholderia sp. BL18I3N2 TaxID=1938799 RepID=UPI002158C890|nr:phosphate-starvation-inducible PsiE family protein [Paraburkholderia sp. BL18I3N2]